MSAGKIKVFLCGEGRNELGSRVGHRAYQSDAEPGVLHALLQQVQADGWEVGGACEWARIRRYRAGGAAHADTRNVVGLAVDAQEAGCDVLAFSRDVDNEEAREDAIDAGIARVSKEIPNAPELIGGVAVPKLEGWILALLAVRGTESLTSKRAEKDLAEKGVAPKDGAAMTQIAESADLTKIPPDAVSLRTWLGRARDVLPRLVAERAGG